MSATCGAAPDRSDKPMTVSETSSEEAHMPTTRVSRTAVVAALAGLAVIGLPTPGDAHATGPTSALHNGSYAGRFSNVADAPTGTKAIKGTATMVLSAHSTKVSLDARGLDPKAVYVAHVHKLSCADMEGGTHFQFDPTGPMMP